MHVYIGLEIHIQLNTRTKIFCSCSTSFGAQPNTHICPICIGYPGVLPALNGSAMDKSYKVAMALNCRPTTDTFFARKNYFYPDLPKNYQISQFGAPIGTNGYFELDGKKVGIHEIHLEEDAGKMIHTADRSLIDYNRSGTPLLEVVTAPDLCTGKEAEQLLQHLKQVVRYLNVSNANMDEGSMRCDANISIGTEHTLPPYKVEVKNINSSRFVRLALEYEIARQTKAIQAGERLSQETRQWNENRDCTEIMRTKEEADDYRYFPEPDLPIFFASDAYLHKIQDSMPELPAARMQRFVHQYGVSTPMALQLCASSETADLFEATVHQGASALYVARWIFGDVQRELSNRSLLLKESPLTAPRFAQILVPLEKGQIHTKLAKQLLRALFQENRDPQDIMRDNKWKPLTSQELSSIVRSVLTEHSRAVDQIRAGDNKPMGFLIGQIMQQCGGRGDPQQSKKLIEEIIKDT